MGAWERFSLDIPKIQVLKDFANHILIVNERDYAHSTLALGACEWIDFVNLLNRRPPFFCVRLVGQLRFKDAGDFIVDIRRFQFSACRIAVITIITNHLFAHIGHVTAHGGESFQCIEHLSLFPIFGPIFHLAGFPMVSHPFLGETCPNDIASKIFRGLRWWYMDFGMRYLKAKPVPD